MASAQISFKPKTVSQKLLSSLNVRTRDMIVKRYGLNEKERKTLESIGREYGITRERVRQIENFAISTVRKSKECSDHENVFDELSLIIKELGEVVSEDILMNHISSDVLMHNHINFLMSLSPKFVKHKEDDHLNPSWSINPEISKFVHNSILSLHHKIEKNKLLKEEDVLARFLTDLVYIKEEYRQNKSIIKRYLSISKKLSTNPLGEWGHKDNEDLKVRGVKDYAFLVLRKRGVPMHFRDIAESIKKEFNRDAHVATTHNELIKDKRFCLISRGMYALSEWGYVSGTVKDLIKKFIEDAGGKAKKEDIIDAVTKIRDSKVNTILVNLQNPKYFKKLPEGYFQNLK